MAPARNAAVFYINGERHSVQGAAAFGMLADYLRRDRGLTGTKIVCAEGDCGACTVLRASLETPRFEAVNACILTLAQLDGSMLITVEGLGQGAQLSPVQEAVVRCHGSQCGYCTPGFVMALTACVRRGEESLDEQKVKNYLTGNLCRCTGYAPLIEAALSIDPQMMPALEDRYVTPVMLRDLKTLAKQDLVIRSDNQVFYAPATLAEALKLRRKWPAARLISSATDLGVQMNKGHLQAVELISLQQIASLYRIRQSRLRITCGARVNLANLRRICEPQLPELARFLNVFASPQIKNMATLVGNVANGSPIGDTLPFLMVSDAEVHLESAKQKRRLALAELYKGYRQLTLRPDELITAVSFSIPAPGESLRLFKVSQRRDLDIATVNGAFRFTLAPSGGATHVAEARIAFGGVGPTVLRCPATENFLQGQPLTPATVEDAVALLHSEISPLSDLRGSAAYRRVLAEGQLRRYCAELQLTPSQA